MNLKKLVNDPELYNVFKAYVNDKIDSCHRAIAQHRDPLDIYREQGKLQAYQKLLTLREEINGGPDQKSLFK